MELIDGKMCSMSRLTETLRTLSATVAELERERIRLAARVEELELANRHLAECNHALKHAALRVAPEAMHLAVAERDELLEELLRIRRNLRELAGGDEQRASGGGALAALEKVAILKRAFDYSESEPDH